ncbi:MAG: type VI secretion system baseplate subunit TssK [Chthoniobacter sp.]
MSLQIHWHEGLFLQPHHLQRFQKNIYDHIALGRSFQIPYAYGVIEMRLSLDELENKRILFDRLRVITRSGIEIDYPRNAHIPIIDIKKAFEERTGGFAIALAVPLWVEERANSIEPGSNADTRAKIVYRVIEKDYADENTGENAKSLLVRHFNARLILEDEDDSDMEIIPLMRITRATHDESTIPRQDPDFTPPCLIVDASPVLRETVRDLAAQVDATRKELTVQLTRGGNFDLNTLRGVQFEQIWRLRTLNRFAGKLPAMVAAPSITPFTWYLELRELLGELVALYPASDDFDCVPYDHDNPILCFRELSAKIRNYLRGAVAPSFWKIDFKREGQWFAADMEEKHFKVPTEYFLGIRTKQDSRGLSKLVENRDEFKLMPKSMIERAFFGLPLKEERHPPLELPASADLHYFRLNRTEGARHWDLLQKEKAPCIRWTDIDSADYQISLYMVVPPESAPEK